MTKEKDEEQLANILLFTVAIKSLVTYRKGEEKGYLVNKVRKARELCSRVTDCNKGLKQGTGLQPDMQLQTHAEQLSGNHSAHQTTWQLVLCTKKTC